MALGITFRLVKNSALTFAEGDENIAILLTNLSGSNINIEGTTAVSGSMNHSGSYVSSGDMTIGGNVLLKGNGSLRNNTSFPPWGASGSVSLGSGTTASGSYSAAFGNGSIASGAYSFVNGEYCVAVGVGSTAIGNNTYAGGASSLAAGQYVKAMGDYQTVVGKFNEIDAAPVFIVADGTLFNPTNLMSLQNDPNGFKINKIYTASSAGGSAGVHLVINIDNTTYKIQLLNA